MADGMAGDVVGSAAGGCTFIKGGKPCGEPVLHDGVCYDHARLCPHCGEPIRRVSEPKPWRQKEDPLDPWSHAQNPGILGALAAVKAQQEKAEKEERKRKMFPAGSVNPGPNGEWFHGDPDDGDLAWSPVNNLVWSPLLDARAAQAGGECLGKARSITKMAAMIVVGSRVEGADELDGPSGEIVKLALLKQGLNVVQGRAEEDFRKIDPTFRQDHLCELGCGYTATHAQHWGNGVRWWCSECVPWSGHYEWCPEECTNIMRERS